MLNKEVPFARELRAFLVLMEDSKGTGGKGKDAK